MRRKRSLALLATAALLAAWLAWQWRATEPAPPAPSAGSPAEARAPGSSPVPPPPEVAQAAAAAARAVVRESPAVFEGKVVSAASGQGVPGAELVFSRSGEASATVAAGDGTFRFEAPRAGRWTLAAATATGFLPFAPEWGQSPVVLEAAASARVGGIVVTLSPAVTYTGRVVSRDGKPLPGASVRLLQRGARTGAAQAPLPDRFTADAAGEFRFVAPDGAVLEARHAGYAPGWGRVDVDTTGPRRVVIALAPATGAEPAEARLSGRVEEQSGAPAEGALVTAYLERGRGAAAPREAVTDMTGRFELPELRAGSSYRVVAVRAGSVAAAERDVVPGEREVVLRLGAGGRLAGTVRERRTGAPVSQFTVAVRSRARWRAPRALAVIDPTGRFEIDGLPPGPAVAAVAAPGHRPGDEIEVVIPDPGAAPAVAEFELTAGGRLEGVVLDGKSRQPLAGAEVEVEGQVELGPSALPSRARTVTGPDGRFQLSGVPEGPVSLRAAAEGHHARLVSGLEAGDDAPGRPIEVVLSPLAPGDDPRVELTGIGAVLAPRREFLRVVDVSAGGGAAAAGLVPGDEVVRIDGRPVAELEFTTAVNLIRGPEGSTVVLGVRKRDDPQQTELRVVVVRQLIRS